METLLKQKISYKELVKVVLKEEPKKGNSRIRQLKKIESVCKISQTGRKYIIEEIYDTHKEIEDKRKYNKGGTVSKYNNDLRPIIIDMLSREFKKDDDIIILTSSKLMKYFMGSSNPTFLEWKQIDNIKGGVEKLATLEFVSAYKDRVWKATNTVLNNLKLESYIGINKENVVIVYKNGITKIANIKMQQQLINAQREVLKELAKERGWSYLKVNQLKKYNLWNTYNNKLKEKIELVDSNISYFYEATILIVGKEFSQILLENQQRLKLRENFNNLTYEADCISAEVDSKRNSSIKDKELEYLKQRYIEENRLYKTEEVIHQFGVSSRREIPINPEEINENEFNKYKEEKEMEKYYEYYKNRMEVLEKTYEYIEQHLEEIDEVFCKDIYIEVEQ